MTFETPEIFAASEAPVPPGQMTVIEPPSEDAAPTSCAVTGCKVPLIHSEITVVLMF